MKQIVALFKRLFYIQINVVWEGKLYVHYARNFDEAMDWLKAYPYTSTASIQAAGGHGLLAARYPTFD